MSADNWISIVYLVAALAFVYFLSRGMKRVSRYDDPAYIAHQREVEERTLAAAELQARALDRISRSL